MKKTSLKVQKMKLSRETVYNLTQLDLQPVIGGAMTSAPPGCGSATLTPECITS